jgi:hypothetical protein
MQSNSSATKRFIIGVSLVLFFLIPAVTACGSVSGNTHTVETPALPVSTSIPQSVTPSISSGVQPCPGNTADPAYWMHIIGTNIDNEHVESVSCAKIIGASSLQALVTERRSDAGHSLDVYVFNNINTSPAYNLLTSDPSRVSEDQATTLFWIAQADELSPLNIGKPVSQ